MRKIFIPLYSVVINCMGKVLFILLLITVFSFNGKGKAERGILLPLVYSTDTVAADQFGLTPNRKFFVTENLDLGGRTLIVPENVILIPKGGLISNGCLIGSNTRIIGNRPLFNRVHIEGNWEVEDISTSMFVDLEYDNSLKDVFALTNEQIHNKVYIGKGSYQVSVKRNSEACIKVVGNTVVKIDGQIILTPNDFQNYSVMIASGDDIIIKGKGTIRGDKSNHLGKDGEWGMGIYVSGCNVVVKNLTIDDCWGDCIYVRGRCNKILIENCILTRGRRQGISITSAKNVKIRKCYIEDVGGIGPEYAIDVEPNKGDTVFNVSIENVKVKRCKGGITASGIAKGAHVSNVLLRNCIVESVGKPVIDATAIDSMTVWKCRITQSEGDKAIAFDHINNLKIENNTIKYEDKIGSDLTHRISDSMGRQSWPLIIRDCDNTVINNNKGL